MNREDLPQVTGTVLTYLNGRGRQGSFKCKIKTPILKLQGVIYIFIEYLDLM